MFCCTLLYVHDSIAIILMGKRELVALLNLSSWCVVMVDWIFLAVPWGCLRFVIVVFSDHTHLLFYGTNYLELLPLLMFYFSFLQMWMNVQREYTHVRMEPLVKIYLAITNVIVQMAGWTRTVIKVCILFYLQPGNHQVSISFQ